MLKDSINKLGNETIEVVPKKQLTWYKKLKTNHPKIAKILKVSGAVAKGTKEGIVQITIEDVLKNAAVGGAVGAGLGSIVSMGFALEAVFGATGIIFESLGYVVTGHASEAYMLKNTIYMITGVGTIIGGLSGTVAKTAKKGIVKITIEDVLKSAAVGGTIVLVGVLTIGTGIGIVLNPASLLAIPIGVVGGVIGRGIVKGVIAGREAAKMFDEKNGNQQQEEKFNFQAVNAMDLHQVSPNGDRLIAIQM